MAKFESPHNPLPLEKEMTNNFLLIDLTNGRFVSSDQSKKNFL